MADINTDFSAWSVSNIMDVSDLMDIKATFMECRAAWSPWISIPTPGPWGTTVSLWLSWRPSSGASLMVEWEQATRRSGIALDEDLTTTFQDNKLY